MLRLKIEKRHVVTFCFLISLFIFASCATAPLKPKVVSPPPPKPEYVTIKFSDPLVIESGFRVTDLNDPKQVVLFAVKLYEKQDFLKAARFFLEAERMVPSDDSVKDFRLACLSAAAISFLEANETKDFVSVMKRADSLMGPFERADTSPKMFLLKAFADKMEGKQPTSKGKLPYSVKQLFR